MTNHEYTEDLGNNHKQVAIARQAFLADAMLEAGTGKYETIVFVAGYIKREEMMTKMIG